MEEDGPNNSVLTRLTCNDKSINDDREAICPAGDSNRPYVNEVLDACVRLLSATKADMKKEEDSQKFLTAVATLDSFGSQKTKKFNSQTANLKITDLSLLKAYVEIALLHAFTRGNDDICIDAAGALKDTGTRFTADVLVILNEKYIKAMEDCVKTVKKADHTRKFALTHRAKKAAEAKERTREFLQSDKPLVARFTLATRVISCLKERLADCGNLAWKIPSAKLMSDLDLTRTKAIMTLKLDAVRRG